MKRKILNGFLMLALFSAGVSTFVSCKDYDEDIYVELRGKITNESTLRENLQAQVDELKATVETLKTAKCNCENMLADYLKKTDAMSTFVTIEEYNKKVSDLQTSITTLERSIEEIQNALKQVNTNTNDILRLGNDVNLLNQTILSLTSRIEALEAAGTVDLTVLTERVKNLEDMVALWNSKLTEVQMTASKAAAQAELNATKIYENRRLIDSLSLVVAQMPSEQKARVDSLIDVINQLKTQLLNAEELFANYYTQDQINNMFFTKTEIRYLLDNLPSVGTAGISRAEVAGMINDALADYYKKADVLNDYYNKGDIDTKLGQYLTQQEVQTLLNNYLTPAQVQTLLNDYYTKGDIDTKLAQYLTESQIQALLNDYYTKTQIDGKFNDYYTKTVIDGLLNDYYKKGQVYTKSEIDDLLANLPASLTQAQVENIVNGILATTMTDYYTKAEVYNKTEIDGLLGTINDQVKDVKQISDSALALAVRDSIRIDDAISEINAIKTNYVTRTELNDSLDKVKARIDDLADRMDKVETALDKLNKFMEDAEKMINSIIIQGTENPVIGYLNTPFDIRSNMLLAYFGNQAKFMFPSSETFTDEELEGMGYSSASEVPNRYKHAGGAFLDTNVGKVYMTINPANIDLEGKTFSLVNSKGEQCGISLAQPAASDKLLVFGYDRTRSITSPNGFFESEATLETADVDKVAISLELEELAKRSKDALKERSKQSIMEAGAQYLRSFNQKLPAYALQAQWDDNTGTRTVTSEYSIAAAAFTPLAMDALHPLKGRNLPGLNRLQSLVNDIFDKIKIEFDIPTLTINDIKFKEITIDKFKSGELGVKVEVPAIAVTPASYNFHIDGGKVYQTNADGSYALDGDGHKIVLGEYDEINKTITFETTYVNVKFYVNEDPDDPSAVGGNKFEIDYTDDINKLIDDITAEFNGYTGDLQKQIADLLDQVRKFSNLGADINNSIDESKNDIADMLNDYITRAYNKLNSVIMGHAYMLFDPTMVMINNGNFAFCSATKRAPTKVSSTNVTLLPTSWTLEYFAPSFKKVVAVTNVYDATTKKKAANAVDLAIAANQGNQMAEVISGDCRVTLKGQPGYIYEVTYACIDYHAKEYKRKFYIQF